MDKCHWVTQAIKAKIAPIREALDDGIFDPNNTLLIKLLDQQSRMVKWCGHSPECLRYKTTVDYSNDRCICGLTDELKAIERGYEMNTELDQACRVVAENILGWEIKTVHNISGGYYYKSKNHESVQLTFLLTGSGMVELMEALRVAGHEVTIILNTTGAYCTVDCGCTGKSPAQVIADTPQEALVLAAAKLVKDMK